MVEKKYMKPLGVFIIVIGFILGISLLANDTGFARFLPNQLGFQIGYIFWMSAIAAIIGAVFTGYILGPLFLVVHKYTIGMRMTFGIQERPVPQKLKIYFKALFPALMALNLAFMFSDSALAQEIIISPEWLANPGTSQVQVPLVVLAMLLPLMSGIALGLFSPVFFLLDAGIVFTNKEKVRNTRDPIEVRSVGGWYNYMLKGYAGISVIISFILFASVVVPTLNNPAVVLVVFLPIIMLIMYIPAFIILEYTAEHRKKFMRKIANRFGIKEPLSDPLDIGKD